MDRRDWIEVYIGGAFGVIAIIAAIAEYCLGDAGALAGCVKDISGTLVVVVLLFASIKFKAVNVKGKLTVAVEDWGKDNAPLIFKTLDYKPESGTNFEQGFKLLQNPDDYISHIINKLNPENPEWEKYAQYKNGYNFTGKFINFPSYDYMIKNDFEVSVVLNQSHFKNSNKDFGDLVGKMKDAFNSRYEGKASAQRTGNALEFTIKFKRIQTKADIENFVDALDFVLSLVKVVA